jgi:hypothetical protein
MNWKHEQAAHFGDNRARLNDWLLTGAHLPLNLFFTGAKQPAWQLLMEQSHST